MEKGLSPAWKGEEKGARAGEPCQQEGKGGSEATFLGQEEKGPLLSISVRTVSFDLFKPCLCITF